jgi:6,7-dimethyl-8-ribityllumazine synthase
MLKPTQTNLVTSGDARIAIVASEYNSRYVNGMLQAAKGVLKRAGASDPKVVRVPGAYEIPVVVVSLARQIAEARQNVPDQKASHAPLFAWA